MERFRVVYGVCQHSVRLSLNIHESNSENGILMIISQFNDRALERVPFKMVTRPTKIYALLV